MPMRLVPLALLLSTSAALAEVPKFDATLAGHAILPAETGIAAPDDAPAALQSSGKFTGPGNLRSQDAAGPDTALPLEGQPMQGFSGIRAQGDGTYLVLTDNGFGSKANSPDAMLHFSHVRPNFEEGTVAILNTTFLHDPDAIVPFPITMEGTDTRYLTGADFDVEGFQVVGDQIVIGDEFGPFVLVADAQNGRILEFHETVVDGRVVQSPDHFGLRLGNPDGAAVRADLRRSRGFEGLALSVDGTRLYPLLEGPLWDATTEAYETVSDGRTALRLLEMDAETRAWTGRSWMYPVEDPSHAIGDFNMIDATRGLVIERDGGQGDAERACMGDQTEGCFRRPAQFKRVYMIDMAGVAPGEPVQKVGYIDLLDIQDPDRMARQGQRADGRFTFPFVTIESVDRVDATTIIVGNDNNFPFSKGRELQASDDNEFILLSVEDFLEVRAE